MLAIEYKMLEPIIGFLRSNALPGSWFLFSRSLIRSLSLAVL